MKKLSLLCVLVFIVSVDGQAATTSTGMELLKYCQAAQVPMTTGTVYDVGYCDGLVWGVAVTAQVTHTLSIPEDVTGRQLQLVVIKYLSDHPESLNESNAVLVLRALKVVYPYKP